MATNRWRGDSKTVAQVVTLVVGSATSGHTFTTTINGKSITYTAGASETTSTVAAAIQALLAASDEPEFREVTWTVGTATVTGTAAVPGVPFTVSKSGTGTYTLTTVTASSGPSQVDAAANWSAGTLPAAGEDVLIDGGADLLYGFAGITPAAYASFRVKASFTGSIGLPFRNPLGYVEYRDRFFPLDTAVPVAVGEGDGAGPARVNLDIDTAAAVTVYRTAPRPADDVPVVNLVGCGSGTVSVVGGDVSLAGDDDTLAATVTTLTVGAGLAVVGQGATATTANVAGGELRNFGACPTVNQYGGLYQLYGTTATALTLDPAPDAAVTALWRAGGTIGTVTARGNGRNQPPLLDCSLDPRAKTVTTGSFTGGAALYDPDKTTVWTNAQTWDRASLANSDLGARLTLTRT